MANFGTGLAGQIISQALSFFIAIYLARILGPADYGEINLVIAIVSYFGFLATFGLPTIGIREVVGAQMKNWGTVNDILSLRIFLAILSYLILVFCGLLFATSTRLFLLLILYGLGIVGAACLTDWIFVGMEDLQSPTIANMLSNVFAGLSIFLLVKNAADIYYIPVIYFVASAIACGFLYYFLHKVASIHLTLNFDRFRMLLTASMPLAITGGLSQIYGNLDMIMLGFVAGSEAVGYYSVAYKIVIVISGVVGIYGQSTLPVMIRLYETNKKLAEAFLKLNLYRMLFFLFPLLTGGMLLAGNIILTFFGEAYIRAVTPFCVLLCYIFLMALSMALSNLLLSAKEDKIYLKTIALGAFANVLANLALIPVWSFNGAAAAMVIAELAVLFYLVSQVKAWHIESWLDKKFLIISILSCVIMAIGIYGVQQIYQPHVGFLILVGAILYIGVSWPFCSKTIGRITG